MRSTGKDRAAGSISNENPEAALTQAIRELHTAVSALNEKLGAGKSAEQEPENPSTTRDSVTSSPSADEGFDNGSIETGWMLDQLPALSANRPEAFERAESEELAALYESLTGGAPQSAQHPNLSENSQSVQAPVSPMFSDQDSLDRLTAALTHLSDTLSAGSGRTGSPLHPGEGLNALSGLVQSVAIRSRANGYN